MFKSALKIIAIVLVGYLICFSLVVAFTQVGFADGFTPGALLMASVYVAIGGFLPMSLVVIPVCIVSVAMRSRRVLLHIGASVAVSLIVPCIVLLLISTPQTVKTASSDQRAVSRGVQIVFVPSVCAALGIVWATRNLFTMRPPQLAKGTSAAVGPTAKPK